MGHARLTDFGLATVAPESEPAPPVRKYYSIRWAAPELLSETTGVSKEMDVYSFGNVVTEV